MVNIGETSAATLKTYELKAELLLTKGLSREKRGKQAVKWEPEFCPRRFVAEHPRAKMEDYRLSDEELEALGKQVTQIRKQYQLRAVERVTMNVRAALAANRSG